MENFVISLGIVEILVFDSDSRFQRVFKDMCTYLGIIYWHIARGNYKVMSVEKYHCFLNKVQAISGQDRVTHDIFLLNSKTSQYAWNSA